MDWWEVGWWCWFGLGRRAVVLSSPAVGSSSSSSCRVARAPSMAAFPPACMQGYRAHASLSPGMAARYGVPCTTGQGTYPGGGITAGGAKNQQAPQPAKQTPSSRLQTWDSPDPNPTQFSHRQSTYGSHPSTLSYLVVARSHKCHQAANARPSTEQQTAKLLKRPPDSRIQIARARTGVGLVEAAAQGLYWALTRIGPSRVPVSRTGTAAASLTVPTE